MILTIESGQQSQFVQENGWPTATNRTSRRYAGNCAGCCLEFPGICRGWSYCGTCHFLRENGAQDELASCRSLFSPLPVHKCSGIAGQARSMKSLSITAGWTFRICMWCRQAAAATDYMRVFRYSFVSRDVASCGEVHFTSLPETGTACRIPRGRPHVSRAYS